MCPEFVVSCGSLKMIFSCWRIDGERLSVRFCETEFK